MKLHLKTLAGEVDALKGGAVGGNKALDERNSRLEAQVEGLQNLVSTTNAEAENVRNRLARSEGRLSEHAQELETEREMGRKLREKVGVLEGVRDVLESELEASANKASAIYSSPVKRRVEKSPFEAEQEWEKEREKLEKLNEELSTKARVAAEKVANLENRLMSEAEDEDVVRARLVLDEKDSELEEMRAKVKELESELLQAVFQGGSGSYGEQPPSSPPPPPPPPSGDPDELSRIRLEAEKWQKAALAAANVAIVAAKSEDDALNKSVDVDTLMGRIDELEKEGWGDRLKRIEGENKALKDKVEMVQGELGVAVGERDEVR